MKTHLLPAIKLTVVCILFFVGAYTLVVWSIGQVVAPNNGKSREIVSKLSSTPGWTVNSKYRFCQYWSVVYC